MLVRSLLFRRWSALEAQQVVEFSPPTQVLALLSLENGLFLAAISLTYGMPLIVELGILFDVLVAAMVLGILIYRIRESFASMDVSRLRRLRG